MEDKNQEFIEKLLEKYNYDKSCLIEIAFDIQEEFNYIPKELLKVVCDKLGIFYSQAYSSISFFKEFRFGKRVENVITVCTGTSCYFSGGKDLLEKLKEKYKNNQNVEIDTAYCYKCCSKYPVVYVNGNLIVNAKEEEIEKLLK